MRRRVRELGWGALGFLAAFLLFVGSAALLGYHVERSTHRTVVKRIAAHQPVRPAGGGDALQPATAGQPPTLTPVGDDGSMRPPKQGGDDGTDPAPPSSPDQPAGADPAPQPSPPPTTTTPSEPAAPSTPAAAPEPESAPGLLDPALTTVCSIADRIAHLCS